MAEYGDPDNPEEWAFIRTFSPYHNVEEGREVSAHALHHIDPRRSRRTRATPARWPRGCSEMGYDVLYYENIEGGHGGAADNKQSAFMDALGYVFCGSS